jgi:hypothetical protein
VGLFYADGDAEGDLFQKPHRDLTEGATAVVPVDDIHHVGLVRELADGVEDDKVSREMAFEFIVVLFMEVSVVHIKISKTGMQALSKVVIEIRNIRADEVRAFGLYAVAEQFADHSIELSIVDRRPKGIFGAGMEVTGENIEIAPEMIRQYQEPELIGGTDIEDTFETEGACCPADRRGGIKTGGAPSGFAFGVEG